MDGFVSKITNHHQRYFIQKDLFLTEALAQNVSSYTQLQVLHLRIRVLVLLLTPPPCRCRLVSMDPQLDRTIFANAPSPLFCRDKYVGNLLQDKPAMIERTPSPLFVDDSYVGNVDSRYTFASKAAAPKYR